MKCGHEEATKGVHCDGCAKKLAARPKGADGRKGLVLDGWRLRLRLLVKDEFPDYPNNNGFAGVKKLKKENLKRYVELRAKAKAQSGTTVVEYIFGYNTREAEDYTPPSEDSAVPLTTSRKGSKPTTVVQQHESDEAILYRLFGGDKKEEDWRDFTNPVLHIIREYKPKLSKEIVADALGKLVQGQNSYKRRYRVTPTLEFITRVKVDEEVLEDVHTIGARAFQLTKENQLTEMA